MKHNKHGHCFWRGMLLFGNAVVYETIIQKYFDDRFQNETRGQTYILV